MEYKITATRLTLYAFISAIEIDLRSFIINNITEDNIKIILDENIILKLKSRSGKSGSFEDDTLSLIDYLDFSDCISLLNKFKKVIT